MSSNAPQRLSPLDVMFLYGERPDTMMHVASLMPFQPPADASPAFLRELVEEARRNPEVHSPWNRKLRYPAVGGQPAAVLGGRQGFRLRLPRAAFGSGQPGRRA